MATTKADLEKQVLSLQETVQQLTMLLRDERNAFANKEYELLQRVYPYIANELDSLRQ